MKEKIAVGILLAFVLLLGIKFCNDKDGYHLDEVYTYILANSEYSPWITDLKEGDVTSTVMTQEELFNAVVVNENDHFNYASVYYNQTKDVHPPMYYFLIHTISSIFSNTFSKWIGLGLNLVLFAATIFLLYHVSYRFFGENQWSAMLTVLAYGMSNIALSTVLFIRMYMLLTLLTLLLTYLILLHMDQPKKRLYIAIAITIFLGMLTQYYYVIYAFCVCAAYDIYLLVKKEYKSLLHFSVAALSGVTSMLAFFPHFMTQLSLQETVSMGKTVRNMKNVTKWLERIVIMTQEIGMRTWIAFGLLLVMFLLFLVTIKRKKYNNSFSNVALIVILPAYMAYIIVAIISPYVTARYVYHLMPVMLLLLSFLGAYTKVEMKKIHKCAALCLLLGVSLLGLRKNRPDYVYNHTEYNAIVEENSKHPCLFVTKNETPAISCALPQLLYFEEVFVTEEDKLEDAEEYIEMHQENEDVAVFVSAAPTSIAPETVIEKMKLLGYHENEQIYENEFYSMYLFH